MEKIKANINKKYQYKENIKNREDKNYLLKINH